jgi:hypothetical protein
LDVVRTDDKKTDAASQGQEAADAAQVARTLSIDEFVTVVGQIDQLSCTATGARLRIPAYALATGTDGNAPQQDQVVECPFGSLHMYQRTDIAMQAAAAAATAVQPAVVQPPPVKGVTERPNK